MGASGTAILDFGAFPGTSEAAVTVTGQAGIVSGSLVECWRLPTVATADKTIDEQRIERFTVLADTIIAATGFTIRGFEDADPSNVKLNSSVTRDKDQFQRNRIYGKYNIGWVWL